MYFLILNPLKHVLFIQEPVPYLLVVQPVDFVCLMIMGAVLKVFFVLFIIFQAFRFQSEIM
jgi:hypothetical protein